MTIKQIFGFQMLVYFRPCVVKTGRLGVCLSVRILGFETRYETMPIIYSGCVCYRIFLIICLNLSITTRLLLLATRKQEIQ